MFTSRAEGELVFLFVLKLNGLKHWLNVDLHDSLKFLKSMRKLWRWTGGAVINNGAWRSFQEMSDD
jgi:hypothetical protein